MARAQKGGESREGRRPWWRRLAGPWGAVIGVATLIGTAVTIYAMLNESAPLNREEVRLEDLRPPAFATNCRPYNPGNDPRYRELTTADLKCEPLGEGPETVKFHLFTNRSDLDEFMRLQRSELERSHGGCTSTGFAYASPWVDREGEIRGELLCADYSDESRLVWSYADRLVTASAASAPDAVTNLHSWWQRRVKFGGGAPRVTVRRRLEAVLPPSFRRCRQMSLLAPAALAGVACESDDGIDAAGAELFATRKLLSDYLSFQADRSGIDDEGCGHSPLSYTSYGLPPTYKPVLGHLLCRPENGVEWFEWTALNPRVYAYASRDDSNFRKLFEQWSQSLSLIEGLEGSGS